MLKDITLGQYFPGKSVLHRLDPRVKILLMIVFVVFVFLADNAASFLYLLLVTGLLVAISRIRLSVILKGMKPVLIISIFTAVINIFWTKGEPGTALFAWKFIEIYPEGLWRALYMAIRIASLVAGTSVLLTYTTTPMELTDALESLLSPLKKIRVPVHEFAMMMSLALRFVPTLIEETEKIINAQKARCADFETGGLIHRAKALIPVLIPLFLSSFRRATELATAMECRCYTGGEGRTRMNALKLDASDLIGFFVFSLLFAGVLGCSFIPVPFGGI